MALVKADAIFAVYPAKAAYMYRVKLKPAEHHYENDGEEPYVKYTCQLCEQLAEKLKFIPCAFPAGTEKCPCCGINIDWCDETGNFELMPG